MHSDRASSFWTTFSASQVIFSAEAERWQKWSRWLTSHECGESDRVPGSHTGPKPQPLLLSHSSPTHTLFMILCCSLWLIPVLSCGTIIFYLVPFLSFPLPGILVAMGAMMLIRGGSKEIHKHRGKENLELWNTDPELENNRSKPSGPSTWEMHPVLDQFTPLKHMSNKILTVKSHNKGRFLCSSSLELFT